VTAISDQPNQTLAPIQGTNHSTFLFSDHLSRYVQYFTDPSADSLCSHTIIAHPQQNNLCIYTRKHSYLQISPTINYFIKHFSLSPLHLHQNISHLINELQFPLMFFHTILLLGSTIS